MAANIARSLNTGDKVCGFGDGNATGVGSGNVDLSHTGEARRASLVALRHARIEKSQKHGQCPC